MMKRLLSIGLALLLLVSAFALPQQASASAYHAFSKTQVGKVLEKVSAPFVTAQNKSYTATKKGKKLTFKKGATLSVLGRNSASGKYFYVRTKSGGQYRYGYIEDKYISIDNSYNFSRKLMTNVNPYNHKKYRYNYYEWKGMPFFQFNQVKDGSINGLRFRVSCGPHALATALSAVAGRVVTPEELMSRINSSCFTSGGKGTYLRLVANKVKGYVQNRYALKYEQKNIHPKNAFSYLKKGYIVLIGVENLDKQGLFTEYSHYITLAGYDEAGNIMTVNTNKKTALMQSFSESRLKKYIKNSDFYRKNTVAIKAVYNDAITPCEALASKTVRRTTAHTHRDEKGLFSTLKENTPITILGTAGAQEVYISYQKSGKTHYGFIKAADTANYANAKLQQTQFIYTGNDVTPQLTVKDYQGKALREDEDYTAHPVIADEVGTYQVRITYLNGYIGATTLTYSIVPKPVTLQSLTAGKKALTARWSPGEYNNGYQVQYARNKGFTKKVKSVNIKNAATLSTTVKKLKGKKKYYVRVRAYRVVKGKVYYSAWSNARVVKTKK